MIFRVTIREILALDFLPLRDGSEDGASLEDRRSLVDRASGEHCRVIDPRRINYGDLCICGAGRMSGSCVHGAQGEEACSDRNGKDRKSTGAMARINR